MTVFDVLRYPIDSNKPMSTNLHLYPRDVLMIWYKEDLRGRRRNPSLEEISDEYMSRLLGSQHFEDSRIILLGKLKKRIEEYDPI